MSTAAPQCPPEVFPSADAPNPLGGAHPFTPEVFPLLRAYLHGLGRIFQRLPALLAWVIFLGITWRDWGHDYNVPALIWHEAPWTQFGSGLCVSLLFWYLWLVTFLVELRSSGRRSVTCRAVPSAPGPWAWYAGALGRMVRACSEPNPLRDGFRWYMAATWLPCSLAVAAPAIADLPARWPFLAGTLTAVAAVWL